MNSLFIRLLLDEDVDVLVALLVRARQFEVTTVRDEGRRSLSDEEQLRYATDHGLTLVTHNRVDFVALHLARLEKGKGHAGIIIAGRRSPYELASRLLSILDRVTADEMKNNLIYI